jgi:DNA-binding transcriptional LysR family regulator
MNDWDLRIFEMVAREGGIGRAAVELNTAQSNVTTRMRHLEKELDEVLFERHSRGVKLTPAGQRLLPYATQVLNLIEQGRRAAKDNGVPDGKLLLGSLETTAALRLPSVLATYARNYPDVDLRLNTGTTASLTDDVIQLRLDGAFVTGPVNHRDLVSELIFTEQLVLVSAGNVANLDRLTALRELKLLVFQAGCSYRARLERILARSGIAELKIQELGSLDAILACVERGVGVTLLPKALVEPIANQRAIALHRVDRAEADAETVFIRRKDSHLSSALGSLLGIARSEGADARS